MTEKPIKSVQLQYFTFFIILVKCVKPYMQ